MLTVEHKVAIEHVLSEKLNINSKIKDIQNQGGGCINQCYCFTFANDRYFLKQNSATQFPEMFSKEKNGLLELQKCNSFAIPDPILVTEFDGQQFLILSYLEKAPSGENYFEQAGRALADLHAINSTQFGFHEDNFIGSLEQKNTKSTTWAGFFSEYRLQPLVKWCADKKLIGLPELQSFSNLYKKLSEIFPTEAPSLLHGDLWGGNAINSSKGPAIYDPAVYYGHREMDIAMTRLFGGFDDCFYKAYNERFPLQKGLDQRIDICNLYPLLVHVKLFGGSYLHDVLGIIKRF